MKIFTPLVFLLLSCSAFGQFTTIMVDADCFPGPQTFVFEETVNGRNHYVNTFEPPALASSLLFAYNPMLMRWEIRDIDIPSLVFYATGMNTFAPDPPNSSMSVTYSPMGVCDFSPNEATVTGAANMSGDDPCVSAGGDSDMDGVCDNDDACPGSPDGDDRDGDGTPDGCDASFDGVNIVSDCFGGMSLDFVLSGLDPVTMRNVYTNADQGLEIAFNPMNMLWEVRTVADPMAPMAPVSVFFTNDLASSPNPPASTTNAYTPVGTCSMTAAPLVTGGGTVSNTPPTAVCQALVGVALPGDCFSSLILAADFDGGSTDPDPGTTLTFSISSTGLFPATSMAFIPVGVFNVTLTVSDGMASAMCTTTVTINDTQPPTINCPMSQTVMSDVDDCNFTVSGTGFNATATDNCPGVTVTNDFNSMSSLAGATFAAGSVTMVTFTADDGSPNSANASCSFTLTVNEPALVCPADQTVQLDAMGNGSLSVADLATATILTGTDVTLSQSAFGCADLTAPGMPITVTATRQGDNCMNSCTFGVTVQDVTPPTITCPASQVSLFLSEFDCEFTIDGGIAPLIDGLASDNCPANLTVTNDFTGTASFLGFTFTESVNTMVTFTADDGSPNSANAMCSFLLFVNLPVLTCPANQTVQLDAMGNASLSVADLATATVLTGTNVTLSQSTFGCADVTAPGMPITVTATREVGNCMNSCTFDVTVQDVTPPTITCPMSQTVMSDVDNCNFTVVGTGFDATASDACSTDVTLTNSLNGMASLAGVTLAAGTATMVTFTADDGSPNSANASCSFTLTVNEPALVCPADQTVQLDAMGNGSLSVADLATATILTGTDVTLSQSAFGCADLTAPGMPITVTATRQGDNCMNSCTFDVTVQDVTPPTITCPMSQTVMSDVDNCNFTVVGTGFDATASDVCSTDVTLTNSLNGMASLAGVTLAAGTATMVTFTADDGSPNSANASCSFTLTVNEPALVCPADQTVQLDAMGNGSLSVADLATATVLTGTTVTLSQSTFGCADVTAPGTPITVTATRQGDNCMNSCTFGVTVEDNVPPVLILVPDAAVTIPLTGSVSVPVATFAAATDACGIASLLPDPLVFDCADIGGTTRQITALDVNGNSTTATLTVAVDFEQPTLTCLSGITAVLDDNCQFELTPANVLTGQFACLDVFPFELTVADGLPGNGPIVDGCGTYTYSLTATGTGAFALDFNTCWGTITVEDKDAPVVTDPVARNYELACIDYDVFNIATLPASVSRCYQLERVSGDNFAIVDGTLDPALLLKLTLDRRQRATDPIIVPGFADACSDLLEVCVQDVSEFDIDSELEGCGTDKITRIFTATELDKCKGAKLNDPATSSFMIFFRKFGLDDVRSDLNAQVVIDCEDYDRDRDRLPAAEEDFPFVVFADPVLGTDVQLFLGREGNGSLLCNLAVSYTDEDPIVDPKCPGSFKVYRVFRVIDWCAPGRSNTYAQVVKVADTDGPELTEEPDEPITFSTNAGHQCGAYIRLDGIVEFEDNCNDFRVFANIYPNGDRRATPLGSYLVENDDNDVEISDFVPVGEHLLVFTAVDACGNSTEEAFDIEVVDMTPPVAICQNQLNVSISPTFNNDDPTNNGLAIIKPHMVDNGSFDDCGSVTLKVARVGEDNQPLPGEDYDHKVELGCDDLTNDDGTNLVRIGLKVIDENDRVNFCWLNVLVEDKTPPLCFAPDDQTITCLEFRDMFPSDLTEADPTTLEGLFGTAQFSNDCEVGVVVEIDGDVNNCGIGEFTRTFTVTDGSGLSAGGDDCEQTITVVGVHDYTVTFPMDQEAMCAEIPKYDGIEIDEYGCELFTVNVDVKTFTSPEELGATDACFKLQVTYEVINWCEYNTFGAPYLIPRDGGLEGLAEDNPFDFQAFDGVARDPETELLYLHVRPADEGDDDIDDFLGFDFSEDFAFLSRDFDPTKPATREFTAFADNELRNDRILDISRLLKQALGPLNGDLTDQDYNGDDNGDFDNYSTDDSRGHFRYVQFIKVSDLTDPVITAAAREECFGAAGADCEASVQLSFSVEDDCTMLGLPNLSLQVDADYDAGDGFTNTSPTLTSFGGTVTANGDGSYTVNIPNVPVGEHALRVQAKDGCGNFDIEIIEFCVEPDKAPTPICISQVTVTLMPNGAGGGMAEIWASDYIVSEVTDCLGRTVDRFSIYREDTAAEADFVPGDQAGIQLTCADDATTQVRIYALDAEGRADYCSVFVLVQLHRPDICDDGGATLATLAGTIATPQQQAMAGVEVSLTGPGGDDVVAVTDPTGHYAFESVEPGADYTLQPHYAAGVDLQRVKTSDINRITTHILGSNVLTTGFAHIAADVTQDAAIDIFDIVSIRRVILGQQTGFANGVNYRFVRADHTFDPSNYLAVFPEVYNLNDVTGSFRAADFVGVVLGDVVQARTGNAVGYLELDDVELSAGQPHTIALRTELAGFQGTLELAAGLELVDVRFAGMEAGNVNLDYAAEGLIGMSYNGAGTELINLEVRATEAGRLSDLVSLTSRLTVVEGVDARGNSTNLDLNFAAASVAAVNGLAQNSPNPVVTTTRIAYTLANAGAGSLTIQDLQGRTVMVRDLEGQAGLNVIDLNVAELGDSAGVLTYTVTAGDFTATKKMVVVR